MHVFLRIRGRIERDGGGGKEDACVGRGKSGKQAKRHTCFAVRGAYREKQRSLKGVVKSAKCVMERCVKRERERGDRIVYIQEKGRREEGTRQQRERQKVLIAAMPGVFLHLVSHLPPGPPLLSQNARGEKCKVSGKEEREGKERCIGRGVRGKVKHSL